MIRYLLFLLMGSLMGFADPATYMKECNRLSHPSSLSESKRFQAWLDFEWRYLLHDQPEFATSVGEPAYNDQWSDLSRAAIERRKKELECPVRVVHSIQRGKLKPAEQLSYDVYRYSAEQALEGRDFPGELLQVNQLSSVHQSLPQTLASMPANSARDFDNMIARLDKSPLLIRQTVDLLREGLARKVMPPRITLAAVPAQVSAILTDDIEQSPLYVPFQEVKAKMPEAELARVRLAARTVIRDKVYPALREYLTFLTSQYIPATRTDIAFEAMPEGARWYAYKARVSTTTRMTPDEIHQLGLKEVERIDGEMKTVLVQSGFKGSLEAFKTFLRTDKQFFFKSKDELLSGYRDIAKRADPELARLFGRLPRLTYGVKAVPEYSEAAAPTAYFEPGSARGGRPGYYFANTYDLKSRPKWEMEALTLHESVPGHHLQMALADEMEGVPEFRKSTYNNAFVEGWGLYAESLGREMGFYRNPYSDFGRLSFEMWRAARLVVDTGMHHLGWSRERAIDFMMSHTAKEHHDAEVEVNRYIADPTQALSYKIGELTFKRLRAEAQTKLGDEFDLRKFHDAALAEGSLPLEILESRMHSWTDAQVQAQAQAHARKPAGQVK